MKAIGYMTGEYPRITDTFIQREVRALRGLGLEVHTFSARRPADAQVGPEQAAEAEATRYLLPMGPFALLATQLSLLLGSPGRYLSTLALAWRMRAPGLRGSLWQLFYFLEAGRLARWARSLDIGHLHNHFADSSANVTLLAAELAAVPFSMTVHGSAVWFNAERWHIGEKVKRASFVACISEHTRGLTMMFSDSAHWSRIHVVHCGVEPDTYRTAEQTDEQQTITFVGRMAAVKGLPVLLKAFAQVSEQHPRARLRLVGDGDGIAELKAQAGQLGVGDRVEFVGPKSPAEVRDLLNGSQAVVLSSFAEGVPVVLMEAMASAVPVVATDVGGTSELVNHQISGFLVTPGSPEALSEPLIQLLGDPILRSRMGEAGRQRVRLDFDVGTEASRLYGLLVGDGVGGPVRPTPQGPRVETAVE